MFLFYLTAVLKTDGKTYFFLKDKRGMLMAYYGSKGWYVKALREMGITRHPIERRKLKMYKTFVLRNLYDQALEK